MKEIGDPETKELSILGALTLSVAIALAILFFGCDWLVRGG